MNRSQLTLLASICAVLMSPCHADPPASRSTMAAKAAVAPAQSVIAAPAASSNVNRAALNPQPLPPGPPPDPDRVRATTSAAGAKNGIIIVGGTPAQKPATVVRKLPVSSTVVAQKPTARINRQALNPQPLPPNPPDPDRAQNKK